MPDETCAFCDDPATTSCDPCGAPLCRDHVVNVSGGGGLQGYGCWPDDDSGCSWVDPAKENDAR